jgi:high-affinity iron transporter
MARSLRSLLLALCLVFAGTPALADDKAVQTSWRLLDYIAVDYPVAVEKGRVISAAEYQEMGEFSAAVAEKLASLPNKPAKRELVAGAARLRQAIAVKADPAEVERIARGVAASLLAAYPVPLAPGKAPDLARGAALYAQQCAACHGADGSARVEIAKTMDPAPIAFTDRERAAERSLFGLYQVIDQGLEGTAMGSFASLPAGDKWALAFQAGRFAYPSALAAEGKRLWESDAAIRAQVPDLAALAALTPSALAERIGADRAVAVTAYLRSEPGAVGGSSRGSTLAIARTRLGESVAAYEAGDAARAKELALSAYLDGFEPVEAVLSARDAGLMGRVEAAMARLRAAIGGGRPASEVRAAADEVLALLDESERVMGAEEGGGASAFVGAFTILLREGLEALLIIVGMLTFLGKAERGEMVRPVHYGWIGALAAGGLTWWVATRLIGISGASRELTEGFGALFAAVVLLFVGIWMHGKSQADEWQRYLKDKVGAALSRGSAWFLFLLAFVAVYREVFETILFFAALSAEGNVGALIAGGLAGVAVLAVIAVLMFRLGRKLPIGRFFAWSSALIAVLAVVLAGKGVGALQEAGMIGVTPLAGVPRLPILGLSPSVETLAAQAATLAILLLGFGWNRHEGRRLAAA